jgi:hypothetical protein
MVRAFSFLATVLTWMLCIEAFAENGAVTPEKEAGKAALTGAVAYSDPNVQARNHQLDAQDRLEAWSGQLLAAIKGGGEGTVAELDSPTADYLSVLYLYCTVKQGPCPFILETVLDSDIIAARSDKATKCASMTRFFKGYLSNALDERAKFLYPLTQGLEMATFNTQSRPRFIECRETVTAILEDHEVVAQRFGERGTALGTLEAFKTLVQDVKSHKIDIYVATGLTKGE